MVSLSRTPFSSFRRRLHLSIYVLIAIREGWSPTFPRPAVCVRVCARARAHACTHSSFAIQLQVSKQMLRFFHFTLQFGIPVEGFADSEHCPPLESSQSQHFPGQKNLFNKLFSKEPGSFGLLVFHLQPFAERSTPPISLSRRHSVSIHMVQTH